MTTTAQRKRMAELMDLLVAHEPKVHYLQRRPMASASIKTRAELAHKLSTFGGLSMDCSESVTLICRLGGLSDPNGNHYNGKGFTGTLLSHLEHYSDPSKAGVGALCVFMGVGPEAITGAHVCSVRRAGKDPLLFSHGQERGPVYARLSAEAKGFHGYTFLSIAKLG